ncbi:MAG: hypothetical protein OXG47_03110 [bacterium]|nr:hypothetical protein [bacterium]
MSDGLIALLVGMGICWVLSGRDVFSGGGHTKSYLLFFGLPVALIVTLCSG